MGIFFDNNFWDYLYKNNLDLNDYFSDEKYSLYITTHGKYEILQMNKNNPALSKYALSFLGNKVKEDAIFGYYSNSLPEKYQHKSGYGVGRYGTPIENDIRERLSEKYKADTKNREWMILFKNEADIELASRAMENVVITFDVKRGPIIDIKNDGGKVITLSYECSLNVESSVYMKRLIELINKYTD